MLSDGQQGSCPDYYIALDHARVVAKHMLCSVQEAQKLSTQDFEDALICARAEIIVKEQLDKEAARKH